jgi:hypothetical protein
MANHTTRTWPSRGSVAALCAFIVIVMLLAAACAPPAPDLTPLPRDKAEQMIVQAIDAVDGVSTVKAAPLLQETLGIIFDTEVSAEGQHEAFIGQLRQVVVAAVPGFVRADPPWGNLILSPQPPEGYISSDDLTEIRLEPALDWYTGKIDDAAFEKTWRLSGAGQ